jgi:hypothetical protein
VIKDVALPSAINRRWFMTFFAVFLLLIPINRAKMAKRQKPST